MRNLYGGSCGSSIYGPLSLQNGVQFDEKWVWWFLWFFHLWHIKLWLIFAKRGTVQ
jgi:hypothetical protein